MLENQIASQASSSRQSGMLPSQSEHPREQAKAITLRSGKQLPEVEIKSQEEKVVQVTQEEEQKTDMIREQKKEKNEAPLKTPPLPFPQRQ